MDHAQKIQRARNSASRKKGKLKQSQRCTGSGPTKTTAAPEDPNAKIIIPKGKNEREADRRERIKQELASQSDSKWTSKKKKRLEKYIEKKLKKEERVLLFEKLAQSQAEIPSYFDLQASGSLGTGKPSTYRQSLDQLEDKEVRHAIEGRGRKRKRDNSYAVAYVDEGDIVDDLPEEELPIQSKSPPITVAATVAPQSSTVGSIVGSALQRNPDGTIMAPKVLEKRTKKFGSKSWKDIGKKTAVILEDEHSDTSFDSSDSANDTPAHGQDSGISEDFTDEEEDASESVPEVPRKRVGFKDWAIKQLHVAKGYDPPASAVSSQLSSHLHDEQRQNKKQKVSGPTEMRGPLGEDLKLPDTAFAQGLCHSAENAESLTGNKVVLVKRPPDVEETRILLPIVTEEQPIMEAILLNPVVVICGETGSGKTTQVPQFLYEAGFGNPTSDNPGMIGITQPRRVAAVSMAARVAHELSLTSSRVSYQIRYDATVSPSTSIKFMTDGVLLRELATDFLLSKYSVIIIDEAHERSVNTDILIGVLSRVLRLRERMWKEGKGGVKLLRLIIMSATLRVGDFTDNRSLFATPPPVINVATRQHPVTIHFSRRTVSDYVTEAIKKTIKIHTRLPPGGVLLFLTGQNEIAGVCRKLEARFSAKATEDRKKKRSTIAPNKSLDLDLDVLNVDPSQADVEAEDVNLGEGRQDDLAFDVDGNVDEEDPEALDSTDEQALVEELGIESDMPMHVLPLYSLLPSEQQMKVFQPPPPGFRLVVVATNVAETSLTIPGIRYVVDSGRAKERRYDVTSGIQSFPVNWISKASAAQRAGRAGRTGPGHCYRLYSSALFANHFDSFALPEIRRMPNEGIVLQMKSMHIDSVVNFPFPTPPDRATLQQAEKTLTYLGALNAPGLGASGSQITPLGKIMALFPLSPRFSRILVNGQQHGCLPYVITVVAALSVGDPFLQDESLQVETDGSGSDTQLAHLESDTVKNKELRGLRRKAFFNMQHTHASLGQFTSDVFKILSVVGAYEFAGGGHKFCGEHFVRPKAMEEIHKLRIQLSNIVQVNFPGVDVGLVSNLLPPSPLQLKVIRQLLAAAFIDQVAVRKDRISSSSSGEQYATAKGVPYRALGIQEDVFIHPSSVLANVSPPEYVVFGEVVRTTRVWLKGVTVVNPAWLSILGRPLLCTFSKPTKNLDGITMTIPRFGPEGWELPPMKAETLQT